MSVQVESLEKNMAKLIIEVPAEELEKAIQEAYQKQKSKISLPGFRKGKVPRQMIEKIYGPEVFYEDAANSLISAEYPKAVVQIEKGKPFIFSAEAAVKPEVTLGTYLGVQVAKAEITVTEEEVDAEVNKERESNARMVAVEGRAIENGDTAVIDYEGFMDGEAFEGGKGENHSLVIGSHTFIPGFEEQLIGKGAGDNVEVSVVFPEEYHAKELAGRPALFQVKINEIKVKELPELDDEFAQDVSEFDTLAEYRESVRKAVEERKQEEARRQKEDEAVQKAVEGAKMEIPDAMLDTQVSSMLEEFASRIGQQGLSLEQYLQFTGATVEALQEQMRPDALKRIQSSLVLEAIAKAEQLEVSEEEFEEEIEHMAAAYNIEKEKLEDLMDDTERKSIRTDLSIQKAVDLITEQAVEV